MNHAVHLILVVKSGWVLTGEVTETTDRYIITNGSVVRRWGTKAGLGHLAVCGKQPSTELDPFGYGEVLKHSVLFTIRLKDAL